MKKIKFSLVAIYIIFLVVLFGFKFNENVTLVELNDNKISHEANVYFFYSKKCDICLRILDKLDSLIKERYDEVNLKTYEISRNDENLNLLFYLLDNYNYKDYDIPIVFIGEYVLVGNDEIEENFKNCLKSYLEKDPGYDPVENLIKDYTEDDSKNIYLERDYITIPIIIISSLIDSVNPCAIAVIIFLITTLILAKYKRGILRYGLTYIITIFIVYLGLGIGFIYFIEWISIPDLFFTIVGCILIILGILSIKDFFWYGKGISLGIPERIKGFIGKNINKATIFSMISLGIIVSIFESTCSGGVYLGILSLIAKQGLNLKLLLLLIVYNFIFVLPLLIILIIFYFGMSIKKINRALTQKKKNVYRIIDGVILIFLGIYLIVWF